MSSSSACGSSSPSANGLFSGRDFAAATVDVVDALATRDRSPRGIGSLGVGADEAGRAAAVVERW